MPPEPFRPRIDAPPVRRPRALGRVVRVLASSALLGSVAGAVTAALALLVFGVTRYGVSQPQDVLAPARFYGGAAQLGAMLGAAFAPLAGWALLRRVPLWRAVLEPAGAVLVIAAACGPFGLRVAIPSGVIAFWLAALRLGWQYRRRATAAAAAHAGT